MSSATSFIAAIPVFQGVQSKFYIVNGKKYHVNFPIAWAHDHLSFQLTDCVEKSGPEECGNCESYGSIRGVFVGYCCNCLQNYCDTINWRGCLISRGLSIDYMSDSAMWAQYPYMSGVSKAEIGDEEDVDLTDRGINLEQLESAIDEENEDDDNDE